MSGGKNKFATEAWYASCKVVLMESNFAQVKQDFACAIGIESNVGDQFFLCQKIAMTDGREYVLERYNFEKNTVFYRELKE